jgi:hypothetical protein
MFRACTEKKIGKKKEKSGFELCLASSKHNTFMFLGCAVAHMTWNAYTFIDELFDMECIYCHKRTTRVFQFVSL